MITWRCEICGKDRPDDKIMVKTFDWSNLYDLPEGTMKRYVNHCNDNRECVVGALRVKQTK
jgi:hypothetical protein